MFAKFFTLVCLSFVSSIYIGCDQPKEVLPDQPKEVLPENEPNLTSNETFGPFVICCSEYPSWSIFNTAAKAGLVNKEAGGELGSLEKKWDVDVVIDYIDYPACLEKYGSGNADAVCITNIDLLKLSLTRATRGIFPTSTSWGADAIIGVGVDNLEDLRSVTTYGLEQSVTQFSFIRILEKAGLNPSEFKFAGKDPEAAALALQGNTDGSGETKSIMVWNPFVLQTLRKNPASKRIGDTTSIPEEVVDMVGIGEDSLKKKGSDRFVYCICDIFYTMSDALADEKTSEAVRSKLGEDFANLSADDMKIILKETAFYATPQDGIRLFKSDGFQDSMSPTGVVPVTCQKMGLLKVGETPTVSFDSDEKKADLIFDTSFMERISKDISRSQ